MRRQFCLPHCLSIIIASPMHITIIRIRHHRTIELIFYIFEYFYFVYSLVWFIADECCAKCRRYSPARLSFKKDLKIPANLIENISNIR